MEFYRLRAFVTVARTGSVTRAANLLHLTQPAVTMQIKAIEDAMGLTLFDRRPGKMLLTRAGEIVLPKAEAALAAVRAVTDLAHQVRGDVTGSMSIGTLIDTDLLRLGSLLSNMMDSMPMFKLSTKSGLAGAHMRSVRDGALAAAFHIGPAGGALPDSIEVMPLQSVTYCIVAPPAMAGHLASARWHDVAALPWIGSPPDSHVQALIDHTFSLQGLSPRVVIEADELATPQTLVESGIGLTLLREDVASQARQRNELCVWPAVQVPARLAFIHGRRQPEPDTGIARTRKALQALWGL